MISESDWQPLRDKKGYAVSGQETCRTSHCIGDVEKAFTLIIQRKAIQGQAYLDLDAQDTSEGIRLGGYLYRAIATNRESGQNGATAHCEAKGSAPNTVGTGADGTEGV